MYTPSNVIPGFPDTLEILENEFPFSTQGKLGELRGK